MKHIFKRGLLATMSFAAATLFITQNTLLAADKIIFALQSDDLKGDPVAAPAGDPSNFSLAVIQTDEGNIEVNGHFLRNRGKTADHLGNVKSLNEQKTIQLLAAYYGDFSTNSTGYKDLSVDQPIVAQDGFSQTLMQLISAQKGDVGPIVGSNENSGPYGKYWSNKNYYFFDPAEGRVKQLVVFYSYAGDLYVDISGEYEKTYINVTANGDLDTVDGHSHKIATIEEDEGRIIFALQSADLKSAPIVNPQGDADGYNFAIIQTDDGELQIDGSFLDKDDEPLTVAENLSAINPGNEPKILAALYANFDGVNKGNYRFIDADDTINPFDNSGSTNLSALFANGTAGLVGGQIDNGPHWSNKNRIFGDPAVNMGKAFVLFFSKNSQLFINISTEFEGLSFDSNGNAVGGTTHLIPVIADEKHGFPIIISIPIPQPGHGPVDLAHESVVQPANQPPMEQKVAEHIIGGPATTTPQKPVLNAQLAPKGVLAKHNAPARLPSVQSYQEVGHSDIFDCGSKGGSMEIWCVGGQKTPNDTVNSFEAGDDFLYQYDDNARTNDPWINIPMKTHDGKAIQNILDISVGANGHVWILDNSHKCYSYNAASKSFTAMPEPKNNKNQPILLEVISVISPTDVYAVDKNKDLYNFDGKQWEKVQGPTFVEKATKGKQLIATSREEDCAYVSTSEDGTVAIVTPKGQAYFKPKGSRVWTKVQIMNGKDPMRITGGIAVVNKNKLYAVDHNGVLWLFENKKWTRTSNTGIKQIAGNSLNDLVWTNKQDKITVAAHKRTSAKIARPTAQAAGSKVTQKPANSRSQNILHNKTQAKPAVATKKTAIVKGKAAASKVAPKSKATKARKPAGKTRNITAKVVKKASKRPVKKNVVAKKIAPTAKRTVAAKKAAPMVTKAAPRTIATLKTPIKAEQPANAPMIPANTNK